MSFERHAANAFQSYVRDALAFSIKRGGLLYGSVSEDKKVTVEAIYEPPQVRSLLCADMQVACSHLHVCCVAPSVTTGNIGVELNQNVP